ncbi:MAG: hypothetical protein JWM93_2676 [Frankiales bacterium]|nr:hypothetical protein [Frankiales bacterium]
MRKLHRGLVVVVLVADMHHRLHRTTEICGLQAFSAVQNAHASQQNPAKTVSSVPPKGDRSRSACTFDRMHDSDGRGGSDTNGRSPSAEPRARFTVPASMATEDGGLVQRPGDEVAAASEVPYMQQRPILNVVHGVGMSADDAAWASLADAATTALKLPGLSPACRSDLDEMTEACLRAAGLPPARSQQESA